MFYLLIAILLGINNGARARIKGQSGGLWIFISAICFVICEIIGSIIILLFFSKGAIDFNAVSTGKETMDEFAKQVTDLYGTPMHSILVLVCGFGGYLLIRYILERMPNKTNDSAN